MSNVLCWFDGVVSQVEGQFEVLLVVFEWLMIELIEV